MHEFVFSAVGREAAETIDHAAAYAPADPDIAVDDPDDVALGLAVSTAHVPDLGVRAQVVCISISAREIRILLFHQDLRIETRIVRQQLLENR